MSRTIRRKGVPPPFHITEDCSWAGGCFTWVKKSDKDLKKALSEFYSDNGHTTKYWCSTNGLRSFENQFQRSYRRDAAEQLRKYMQDPSTEVQLLTKPRTDYWD